jgi:hypothetical protein
VSINKIENIRKATKLMEEAFSLFSSGPFDYYLTELVASYDLLIQRFAPFKVGDRVRLRATPEINEKTRYGWLGYKGILVQGAIGTVVAAECGSKGFAFAVQFDADDSLSKGLFYFGENDLKRVG